MARFEEFARIFNLPPAMYPHIHFVVDEREMDLVVSLGARSMGLSQVAETLSMPMEQAEAFLERAFHRRIINKTTEDGATLYSPATFYERLDPLSMYENWGDVPADARDAVIEWDMQEFIDKYLPIVEEIKQNPDAYHKIPNRDVLLLDEALAQVEAATDHVVVPCDCRCIVQACSRPTETCIRLDEGARMTLAFGHGRKISKDACKAIVINAHRAGLMQTGLRDWREHGLFGFCNCCACDCFPIRAGIRLGMSQQWPRSHYIADRDMDRCIDCGVCTTRCHFEAFYFGDAGTVEFDPGKCWGCGLCSTTCQEEAIQMVLRASLVSGTEPV